MKYRTLFCKNRTKCLEYDFGFEFCSVCHKDYSKDFNQNNDKIGFVFQKYNSSHNIVNQIKGVKKRLEILEVKIISY